MCGTVPNSRVCPVENCEKRHHKLLHTAAPSQLQKPQLCAVSQPAVTSGDVLLRIAPVTLHGPAGDVQTSALFDEGSTVTLIDGTLASELGATGPDAPLTLAWTDGQKLHHTESQRVELQISGPSGEMHPLRKVRTVTDLHLPPMRTPSVKVRATWPHLAHVPAVTTDQRPKLLFGQDNIGLTISREVIEGPLNTPVASRTLLGWVIHGHAGITRSRVDEDFTFHAHAMDDDFHHLVKESFRTENFGVSVKKDSQLSREEKRAQAIQKATTQRSSCGTRWETGLLWNNDDSPMPPSKASALTRLTSLERKLARLREFAKQYTAQIQQYLIKNYAEKLSPDEAASDQFRTWYLPHFGVTNPNKPGKLRLVFDAAAKSGGRSLNDALLPGPDLLRPLPSVLFSFRERPIAFGGDIAEMFHQIQIEALNVCGPEPGRPLHPATDP